MSDVVEAYDLVVGLESGGHEPPHILIAAVSMSENDGLRTASADYDIVPINNRHSTSDVPYRPV